MTSQPKLEFAESFSKAMSDNNTPEDDAMTKEIFDRIAGLDGICKQVLLIYFYKEKSLEEVGDIVGYSASNVWNWVRKCLAKLKPVLAGYEVE